MLDFIRVHQTKRGWMHMHWFSWFNIFGWNITKLDAFKKQAYYCQAICHCRIYFEIILGEVVLVARCIQPRHKATKMLLVLVLLAVSYIKYKKQKKPSPSSLFCRQSLFNLWIYLTPNEANIQLVHRIY